MKKNKALVAVLGLLVLSLVMTGCLGISRKDKPAQFGDVIGVVTYIGGKPIAGAEVSIASITAIAEEDGSFTLSKVPYGNHSLVVREPLGYLSHHAVKVDADTQTVEIEVEPTGVFYLDFEDAADSPLTVTDKVNGLTAEVKQVGETEVRVDGINPFTGKPAVYFDNPETNSSGSFMYVLDDPSIDLTDSDAWTFELFFRAEEIRQAVLLRKTLGTDGTGYQLGIEGSSGRLYFRAQNGAAAAVRTPSGSPLQAKTWYHVAVTWDGEALRMYLDGEETQSASYTAGLPDTDFPLGIGALQRKVDLSDEGQVFYGHLGEIRISNRALSPDEFMGAGVL